ncbi:MAG: sugar ABC transporter substrate-binding protein [Euzebyaceae bacterium]|nr:sugar ABC transporter substrate-binding protein [Euzebyaceae bacterium]
MSTRVWRMMAALSVAALVAAGCGGTETGGTADEGPTAPAATTEGDGATATPTPAETTGTPTDAGPESPAPETPGTAAGAADVEPQAAALEEARLAQIADSLRQAEPADDLPFSATLADGSTFELDERVAEKVRNGEPVNYVFSYQSSGIPLFSDQYRIGYEATLPIASELYPLDGTAVAPAGDIDIPQQISQIEALLNTDQIDCLSIEPPDSDAFTAISNQAMAAGIPVFTVGVTSNGNEFTNFTQIPLEEGRTAAEVVVDQLGDTTLETVTVSGGDPTAFWAQGRMTGFEEGIKAAFPDATFINTASNPLSVTYDPAQTYDAYTALLTGQPDLDFILNVDIGAEHAARAIRDAGRQGETFTAGWNVSLAQLDAIEEGVQLAAFDQRWSEQAGFGAVACAALFATGGVMPNTQQLIPVTKDNAEEARADLEAILG